MIEFMSGYTLSAIAFYSYIIATAGQESQLPEKSRKVWHVH